MDAKTLEWMGERVDKAREIIKTIAKIEEFANDVENVLERPKSINYIQISGSYNFGQLELSDSGKEVLENIVKAIVKAARKEIVRLEQLFKEL